MDLFSELEWRGLVYDATEGVRDALAREKVTGYIGFDPTAASLHVGSLLMMMALAHMQRHGHSPVAVVGGGTGLIGDPSGKSAERQLMSFEQVETNVAGIRGQLSRFLDFDSKVAPARLVNNADWLTKLSAVDFMRDVGKHFTINAMLAKESVKRRIESEDGITYTEFSYSLLQAYDFLELYDRLGCTLQMGGSDQWGNITAGMDLIRRLRGGKAHGLVMPLITTSSGVKFGKTESGTIWLDPVLTSPYQFYQFWLNAEDQDAVRYLRFFTFFGRDEIVALEDAGRREPDKRHSQRALAREVTRLVHGETAVAEAESAATALFADQLASLNAAQIEQMLGGVPSATVMMSTGGWPVTELLTKAGVTKSKSEAQRLIRGGGISINDRRITDEKEQITVEQAIEGRLFVVRKGKRDYFLIRIERG
ncbi:MAG TPA: tyrosine--tRNA ligase [Vicinamibacterales bacterium]|jgi:tyrosyl-tRNA synthetase|nr:tyrosine--tRNA ligase [Vicinamibacterales bacterium]